MRSIATLFGAFIVIFSAAHAGEPAPLTEDQVKGFIASIDEVESYGEEMEKRGENDALEVKLQPQPGEKFHPFSKAVSVLKTDFPSDYARLSDLVRPHGFKAAESWGETGDRIVIAYLAEKMEQENPGALAQAEAMDPSMLEQMPAQMRAQIATAMMMVQTVRETPKADREVIRPFLDDLDAHYGE